MTDLSRRSVPRNWRSTSPAVHPACAVWQGSQLQSALSTKKDARVGDWAAANNVELAYVPTNASWRNRIEAQFQALRYCAQTLPEAALGDC